MTYYRMYWMFAVIFVNVTPVFPKEQYVEPLLFGMKVSIPYDMANLFTRFPFQGSLSVVLGLVLAGILFFGVITAPFGYMFGVPSEKYVMGGYSIHPASASRMLTQIDESVLLDYVRSEKVSPRTIFSDHRKLGNTEEEQCCQTFLHYFDSVVAYLDHWEPGFVQKMKPSLSVLRNRLAGRVGKEIVNAMESTLSIKYPAEYTSSMFHLISEDEKDVRNQACQQRLICHAHGALHHVPPALLKFYQKFSKKLSEIPPAYVEAMRTGMKNESHCAQVYSNCRDNAFTLALKSYLSLLPDKTQINSMPRRKQGMYNSMKFSK